MIAGKIFTALGAALLFLACVFLLLAWSAQSSGGFLANFNEYMGLWASAVLALIGLPGLLFGLYLTRESRELREFNEAMNRANRRREGQ